MLGPGFGLHDQEKYQKAVKGRNTWLMWAGGILSDPLNNLVLLVVRKGLI